MAAINYTEAILETVEELIELERSQHKARERDRVRFLRLLKEGKANGQEQAGALIGLKRRQSQVLWQRYKKEGLAGYIGSKYKGSWSKLSAQQQARMLQRLDQDDILSQQQIIDWIKAEMGIVYTQGGISGLLARLKVKLKTGRPVNVRKDKAGEEAFKKKVPDLRQQYKEDIYFTDEMRYGTRTHCKGRWSRQGKRPVCRVKLGYEWGYLYVAICPFTGDMFSMFFTHLDKDCFAYFLAEFEQHLKKKDLGKVLLIGDGASAHTSQQWQQEKIHWQRLPTACPELNPVERFFEELRRHTANRVFENKDEVEKLLENLMQQYLEQPEKVKSITLFPYLNKGA